MSTQTDIADIKRITTGWLEAIERKDAAAIARHYAEDSKFLIPNRPLVAGRAAAEKAWRALLAAPGVAINFGPTEVSISGTRDAAWEIGTYTFSLDGPDGRWKDRGKYTITWKKVAGAWQVAVDALNSDLQNVFPNV